jgi:hypothetical protein
LYVYVCVCVCGGGYDDGGGGGGGARRWEQCCSLLGVVRMVLEQAWQHAKCMFFVQRTDGATRGWGAAEKGGRVLRALAAARALMRARLQAAREKGRVRDALFKKRGQKGKKDRAAAAASSAAGAAAAHEMDGGGWGAQRAMLCGATQMMYYRQRPIQSSNSESTKRRGWEGGRRGLIKALWGPSPCCRLRALAGGEQRGRKGGLVAAEGAQTHYSKEEVERGRYCTRARCSNGG